MSDTIKGSWSRVQDHHSYHSNYDNIFRRPAPVEPQPQPPVEEQPAIETPPSNDHTH